MNIINVFKRIKDEIGEISETSPLLGAIIVSSLFCIFIGIIMGICHGIMETIK